MLALALSLLMSSPPNVVIIFCDDLGYGDLSCQGEQRWRTPHLDAMAAEGVRFTDFCVSQPVCSASRASLLTGCYANRISIHGALGPHAKHGLSSAETTLAELCKAEGYATAIHGKWHLGHLPPFLPTRHGFDEFSGIPYSNDMWPSHPEAKKGTYPPLPFFENEEVVRVQPDQKLFTTGFTDRIISFIRRSHAANTPFFAYLAHPMPHVPLFVSEAGAGQSGDGVLGDVIAEIDRGVGQILETLQELGIDEDTLVLFTSDNGPWLSYGDHAGTTAGLREGKGTTFEGGVRVPCIARWPGTIPAGRVSGVHWMTIDVLPTIAALIDAPLPEQTIDGRDATLVLLDEKRRTPSPNHLSVLLPHGTTRSGEKRTLEAPLAAYLPHHAGAAQGGGGKPGRYRWDAKIQESLFDLESDPYEQHDVASIHPDVVYELRKVAEHWRTRLGDALTDRTGSEVRPAGQIDPPAN